MRARSEKSKQTTHDDTFVAKWKVEGEVGTERNMNDLVSERQLHQSGECDHEHVNEKEAVTEKKHAKMTKTASDSHCEHQGCETRGHQATTASSSESGGATSGIRMIR